MTVNYFPSNLQWVGLAKETVPNTAETAPTVWVPGTSPKWTPNINPLVDQAFRGMMGADFAQVQGMRYDELAYTTYVYQDSVFQHFLALLGYPDSVTGTADPYTHSTALYNGSGTNGAQPPTFTGFYFDAAGKCWQIPGMVISSLKLTAKTDDLVSLDVSWMGLAGTAMGAAPTNTPSTDKPAPSWNGTVTLAAAENDAYSEVELTYTRDTKAVETISGAQTPVGIFSGALTVTGTLTSVYQGSTDVNMADFIANTQPALTVKIAPAGDATHYLQLQHSAIAWDKGEINSGSEWQEFASTIKALMNATDALDSMMSPVKVTFLTSQQAAY